jgi:molybdenum cofactor cytidylyltransferase
MAADRRIEELFEEPPETWGLRGDPYLWTEMRLRLGEEPLPPGAAELRQRLEREFLALTGKEITTPEQFYVEAFAHGGLSSGYISPQFWRDVAIPKLLASQAERHFTLKRNRWYACEFLGAEYGGALRACTAIRVLRCEALKTGRGWLELSFLQFRAPETERNVKCRVQILERSEHFLLARSLDQQPVRYLLLHAIDRAWLHQHLGISPEENEDLQRGLDRHAG